MYRGQDMSAEKRAHERYDVVAQVQIEHGDDVEIFTATNVSIAGMFFEARLDDHPDMIASMRFPVMLSLSPTADTATGAPPPPIEVRCTAKIIRRDTGRNGKPSGFGVCFDDIDAENIAALRRLIAAAQKK